MHQVQAVAFDVVETLMSLESLPDRLAERGYSSDLFDLWFTRSVRDGMALGAAGGYRSFREVSANALRDVTGAEVDEGTLDHLLGGWDRLPAHPDVAPALEQLAAAGVRVVALSTGSAETIGGFLANNGLSSYFEDVLSCEEVGIWKPAAGAYRHAVDRLGTRPEHVALVAAHAWDCHGAKRAGLATGWVSRLEGRYSRNFEPADVMGDDLPAVVQRLLGTSA